MSQTLKKDAGKIRPDLIPVSAIEGLAEVLTFGLQKYSEDSWRKVDPKRYKAALLRHIIEYLKDNKLDDESGLHHLKHALCNCAFLLEMDNKVEEKPCKPEPIELESCIREFIKAAKG